MGPVLHSYISHIRRTRSCRSKFLSDDVKRQIRKCRNARLDTKAFYRGTFAEQHQRPAPPPVLLGFCYCDKDVGKAKDRARKYLAVNYLSILQHYEFMEDYHIEIKGYSAECSIPKFLLNNKKACHRVCDRLFY